MADFAMRISIIVLGALFLAGGACQSGDQITVGGTLLGSDGEPMRHARIKVERSSGKVIARATADADGRYTFALDEPGGYGLTARGRRHETIEVPLVLTSRKPVQLDIGLTASEAEDDQLPEVTSHPVTVGEIVAIYLDVEARKRRIARMRDATTIELKGGERSVTHQYRILVDQERAPVFERIETESQPLLRQWLLLRFFDGLRPLGQYQHLALEALQTVPPTSPLWTFEAWSTVGASKLIRIISSNADSPEEVAEYVQRVIDDHPDPEVRAQFLDVGLYDADRAGDEEAKWRYYNQLQTEHRRTENAARARRDFDERRRVKFGKPVPKFSFVSLDDRKVIYTNRRLLGTTYLIDFWGTWCGPCIKEIPEIQDAYHKYHEAGFQILSVAMQDEKEAIEAFRKDRYSMPWMHTLVSDFRNNGVKAAFEINGLPRPILVNGEGKIIAVDDELRDGKLLEVLAEVFGKDS
ncbi:MAG: thioredoxin-like domain-containing protein [Bacteroidota bacterium]|nr:thioredoxin-like domain-containing protein [Bacteroidota bacterium]